MKKALLNRLAVCLASSTLFTSALLAIVPSAIAQNAERSTCAQDMQGLMCSAQEGNSTGVNESNQAQVGTTAALPSVNEAAIQSAQLGAVSNFLIGLAYFVLPAGLGLALFLHDKHEDQASEQLSKQIELLERIWNQNLQH